MRLIISEKANAAKKIAQFLAEGKVKDGKHRSVPHHTFAWQGEECVSVGLKGHVLNLEYPEEYSNWQKVEPSSLIDAEIQKNVSEKGVAEAIAKAHARSGGQPVSWCSDGWRAYPKAIRRAYRRAVRTGRRGRPPLRVPEGDSLTQTTKHRDEHGRLLSVEIRATIGTAVEQPVPVHIERLNGVLRDRLACLTRKTHAFAKSTSTWDALFGLALFEHNWLRTHPALLSQLSSTVPGRCYDRRTPAMAIGLTDHRWSWQEFLTTKATVSS